MSYLYFITDEQIEQMSNDQLKLLLRAIDVEHQNIESYYQYDAYYKMMSDRLSAIEATAQTYVEV